MANQRDLKAFVRYDGSGRVVAGSLVLRKKKPKVGRWQEILTYECCNPTTTTTTTAAPTTTTTSSSTSTTTTTQSGPYQFTVVNYNSPEDACAGNNPVNTTVIYKSTQYLSIGATLWLDAGLTQPYQAGMASWLIFTNPGYQGAVYSTTSNMGTTLITGSQNC